jgi:hypothetical protein
MKSLAMSLALAIAAVVAIAASQETSVTTPANADPPTPVSGPVLVTSITTEAVAPSGQTELAPSSETKTQIAAVYGTVTAYEPGRSITLLRPNATAVTYTIDGSSTIPSSLAAGRRVVVRTITRPGLGRPLVQKVTYSRKTRSTTVK